MCKPSCSACVTATWPTRPLLRLRLNKLWRWWAARLVVSQGAQEGRSQSNIICEPCARIPSADDLHPPSAKGVQQNTCEPAIQRVADAAANTSKPYCCDNQSQLGRWTAPCECRPSTPSVPLRRPKCSAKLQQRIGTPSTAVFRHARGSFVRSHSSAFRAVQMVHMPLVA